MKLYLYAAIMILASCTPATQNTTPQTATKTESECALKKSYFGSATEFPHLHLCSVNEQQEKIRFQKGVKDTTDLAHITERDLVKIGTDKLGLPEQTLYILPISDSKKTELTLAKISLSCAADKTDCYFLQAKCLLKNPKKKSFKFDAAKANMTQALDLAAHGNSAAVMWLENYVKAETTTTGELSEQGDEADMQLRSIKRSNCL